MVFHDQRVRDLMDMKIFVDTGLLLFYLVAYMIHNIMATILETLHALSVLPFCLVSHIYSYYLTAHPFFC